MRITGANASAPLAASAGAPRRSTAGGFTLSQATPAKAGGTATLRTIGGIDALMALQGAEDATERRRRAVRRGGGALDALDALKVAMLSEDLTPAALNRLKAAEAGLAEATGDPRLDAILGAIELRLAVEIAKLNPVRPS